MQYVSIYVQCFDETFVASHRYEDITKALQTQNVRKKEIRYGLALICFTLI